MTETIAAIATAAGEGGIGIIRISGPGAFLAGDKIFQSNSGKPLDFISARYATLGKVVYCGEVIDEALVLKFPAPASYTGEDVLEIQAHGGTMACRLILQAALEAGARLAEPGEFTKRAFLNGKIDLLQAEAVIDTIRAKTGAALRAAGRSLNGKLSAKVEVLRSQILQSVARIAVAVDYPEDDIEEVVAEDIGAEIIKWQLQLEKMLVAAGSGRILRDGLRTAILGRPNAGKSSLLNELLGAERAIVTDIPGTTRDTIEEYANINGVPVILMDTAGLRDAADAVERIGIGRSVAAAQQAELVIYVVDGSVAVNTADFENIAGFADKTIIVINKTDLETKADFVALQQRFPGIAAVEVSIFTGTGIDNLKKIIGSKVFNADQQPEQVAISNTRQIDTLRRVQESLMAAGASVAAGMPVDIIGVDLQLAWEILGELNGETTDDSILDRIFEDFCVGK